MACGLQTPPLALASSCHLPLVSSIVVFMGEPRPQKFDLRDFLPPMVVLILIGLLFIPAVKKSLDELFVWSVALLSSAVIALVIRAAWRGIPARQPEEAPTLMPIFIHSEEERAKFRAMCGVTERSPKPMKVVTPEVDDGRTASDSADKA